MYCFNVWKSIFNALYLVIFIRFLRNILEKMIPSFEHGQYPRYLILALFSDKGMLLGYTDSIDDARAYMEKTTWGITISKLTPYGYRDIDHSSLNEPKRMVSLYWSGNSSKERDIDLARTYGFNRTTIEWLVRTLNNTVYY
jgi:hypothetical protein